jgi:hypothetical protein
LHITTHVEGDKYDKLLREKGGTGFPTLAFMDADGNVLAKHEGQRSVAAFESSAAKAKEFLDLKAKAEAGDRAARIELLKKQIDYRHFGAHEAKKRVDAIADLDEAARKEFADRIVTLKVYEILSTVTRDTPTRVAAGKRYNEMRLAGEIPSGDREFQYFWTFLLEYAESVPDVKLFEEGVAAVEARWGTNARYRSWIDQVKAKMAELKGRDY